MIYYSRGYIANPAKEEALGGGSGEPGQVAKSPLRQEHAGLITPPAMSCVNTCELLSAREVP